MKKMQLIFFFSMILFITEGCEHKELCYDHHHGVTTRIYVDWTNAPEPPTGMTVIAYPLDGGEPVVRQTNETEYTELKLHDGDYQVLAFNQIPSEFETVGFAGLDTYDGAYVYAKERKKTWYQRNEDERVVHDIEWLGSGSMSRLVVNNLEMQAQAQSRSAVRYATMGTISPEARIVDIKVTVHVNGIQNVRSMRGSIDGLAGGCMLTDGAPVNEKVTHLLENWEVQTTAAKSSEGQLVCHVASFGLPGDHKELTEENHLKLSVLLVDNKTVVNMDYPVGERFEVNTEIGLELNLEVGTEEKDDGPMVLPDVEPAEGSGGGFDVSVDDWGDVEDIEIPT